MISFITTDRNDDFASDASTNFIDRMYMSISKNIENIDKFDVPYEYLIVEWNPTKEYLIFQNKIGSLFKNNKNLINIVVTQSVSIKENLALTRFYEYFAKNVGIRNAKYDTLIILNADIILPYETVKTFIDLASNGFDPLNYYVLTWRKNVDLNFNELNCKKLYPLESDILKACGSCPGDLFVANKQTIIEKGKGFNENALNHRQDRKQSGMDAEMLWNMYYHGCQIQYLENEYIHLDHNQNNWIDCAWYDFNKGEYENNLNWGCINYNKNIINNQLIIIS